MGLNAANLKRIIAVTAAKGLKAFNKIKEITHGDNGNVMKKYKIVETNDVSHNLTF
jgi:hypothetical protein